MEMNESKAEKRASALKEAEFAVIESTPKSFYSRGCDEPFANSLRKAFELLFEVTTSANSSLIKKLGKGQRPKRIKTTKLNYEQIWKLFHDLWDESIVDWSEKVAEILLKFDNENGLNLVKKTKEEEMENNNNKKEKEYEVDSLLDEGEFKVNEMEDFAEVLEKRLMNEWEEEDKLKNKSNNNKQQQEEEEDEEEDSYDDEEEEELDEFQENDFKQSLIDMKNFDDIYEGEEEEEEDEDVTYDDFFGDGKKQNKTKKPENNKEEEEEEEEEEEVKMTKFQKKQMELKKKIKDLEEAALAEKPWVCVFQ